MVTKLVTELKVSPADWLTNPNSINASWQIWYRYNGHLVKVMGMNREKIYSERVKLTLSILKSEELKLTRHGYNPLTKTSLLTSPEYHQVNNRVHTLGFLKALYLAFENLTIEHNTRLNIKSCLKYISIYAAKIGIDHIPICDIRRSHLKSLFTTCEIERSMSPRNWNAYRTYLMMLFEELEELEMVDHNPLLHLKKKKEITNVREILSDDERKRIKDHLNKNHPSFYRFIQIFFHSGSRRTELLSLKVKDVNLKKGEFVTLVKKGSQKRYVKRVIKSIALPYWEQQFQVNNEGDFVFSIGLLPGPHKIREEQITRRWKRLVKDKLGITADLYSLKHLNTDETASILDIEAAAKHNGHTSTQVTKKHYAFGEDDRLRQRLKTVSNHF